MTSLRSALDRALDVMQREHRPNEDVQRVRRVREVIATEGLERPSFEVWPSSDDDRVL